VQRLLQMACEHRHDYELGQTVQGGEGHGVHDDMLVEIAFHFQSSISTHYADNLTENQDGL
jgi:hypothetical protein